MICSKCGYEKFTPNINIHPGETLKDILKHEEMKHVELSYKSGMGLKLITNISTGKARITPRTAIKLEKVFDVSAEFWLNMQQSYDLYKLRQEEI